MGGEKPNSFKLFSSGWHITSPRQQRHICSSNSRDKTTSCIFQLIFTRITVARVKTMVKNQYPAPELDTEAQFHLPFKGFFLLPSLMFPL